MILKPDKGQGVVLVNIHDYYRSLENIFGDTTKFRVCSEDPTGRRTPETRGPQKPHGCFCQLKSFLQTKIPFKVVSFNYKDQKPRMSHNESTS